jgi:hypothetical protein
MSIEMENPRTTQEKADAAHNLVEQIRIALSVGDEEYALRCVDRASLLLHQVVQELETK